MNNRPNKKQKFSGDIPEGVVDIESYTKWLEMINCYELNEGRNIIASDETKVDLLTGIFFLKKKIAHLPDEEQAQIWAESQQIRKIHSATNVLKRKAFGVKTGPKSAEKRFYNILFPREAEIIELFGRFHSIQEVHKVILEDMGIDVSAAAVRVFRERHADKIKERQDEYQKSYSNVRLGQKRARLDELTFLYNDRKAIYLEKKSREDQKLLQSLIEQIRKEAEGDKLIIEGNLDVNIQQTIDIHIQTQILKQLNITDVIIGRIAAKRNVDPKWIIAKIHSSFYAKFSSLLQQVDYSQEVLYPSDQIYDFDKIRQVHESRSIEESKPPLLTQVITEKRKEAGSDIKKQLIEMLGRKQKEINEANARINNLSENQ